MKLLNNGDQETVGERPDRIERALDLMPDDHIKFREEQKWLLSAQVQMQGGLEELRAEVPKVTRDIAATHEQRRDDARAF